MSLSARLAPLGLLLLAGCLPERTVPGDQVMGTFAFTATVVARDCSLDEVLDAGFSFEGTLSRDPTSGDAWLTLDRYPRDAGWDGRVFTSSASAHRVFTACGECPTRLEETLTVALLSASQAAAVGGVCPPDPLDGGVPAPNPDAGLYPPAATASGFDAQLACGELSTVVRADPADAGVCPAACDGCRMRWSLAGERR